jgi:hypothetical protein
MRGFPGPVRLLLAFFLAGLAGPAGTAQEKPAPAPATQTAPAAVDGGTLVIRLSGNRNFCVDRNEVDFKPGSVKPRQQRNAPLVTTFGYKYQVSASRRGTSSITKLMESPTIRTAYMKRQPPDKQTPQPRLATPKDQKNSSQPFQMAKKVPHWIPEGTCTTLQPEYSFSLAPGRYDIYLGFDVLLNNGQWAPMQSDYVTDVLIEKGLATRVLGRVDYTDGVRTVKLESSEKPGPPEKP